jgi:hypothetical protein
VIYCWHRPGRIIGRAMTCRHCGVAIDWCPCIGIHFRSVDDGCGACLGSMWVAIVRSRREKLSAYIKDTE